MKDEQDTQDTQDTPSGRPGRRGTGRPRRGGHFGGRGGWQHGGGWQQGDLPDAADAAAWFAGRIPDDWFTGDLKVTVDRDEITVIGELPAPESDEDAAA